MYLVRDVLDKQLLDHFGNKIGRVDGIVLQISAGGSPPEVIALETGCAVQAARVSIRFKRWVEKLCAKTGANSRYRIGWPGLHVDGLDVRTPVAVQDTPAVAIEKRLGHLLGRLPGGRPAK
jgi:hypothetical protein